MPLRLHLIFGDDEYRVSTRAKEIVAQLVPAEEQSLGLEIVNGRAENADAALQAARSCEEALRTSGFFGGRKAVWFQDVSFLADNPVGRTEAVKDRVNRLAALLKAGLPPGVAFVVTAPKADKRYAFFKVFKEAGEIEEFAVPEKSYAAERQAETTLAGLIAKAGLRMAAAVREAFRARVGVDTRQMAGEIEKLAVYLGDRKDVTLADVDAVTCFSRETATWDLADAVGRRELSRALATLDRLLVQKESPIGLIIALESRVRELMIYREALDSGWLTPQRRGGGSGAAWGDVPPTVETVFSEHFEKDPRATHPYRVGLLAEQARRFTAGRLRECQRAMAEAHEAMVSSGIPQATVLETLLVKMLS